MVKYVFTLLLLGTVSALVYQQPACSASNHATSSVIFDQNKAPFIAIGQQIRIARLKKQIDTAAFTEATGITPQKLEDIEKGKIMPNKEILYTMEAILEVTIEVK
jgi:ribosome-binding protein aMBF1 (putative translation factor)